MGKNISPNHNTVFILFLTFLIFAIVGYGSSQKLKLTNSSKRPIFTAKISNVTCLALSPDNTTIYAGLSNSKIIAYNISTSTSIPLDINCNGTPARIAVHPNGAVIGIATSDGNIELWNIEKNKQLILLSGVAKYLGSLCFSSTGSMIMATYASGSIIFHRNDEAELGLNPIMIWDTNSGTLIRRFDGHGLPAHNAKFSTDGNFVFSVAGSSKNDFLQWNVNTGEVVKKFTGEPGGFMGINISQDNKVVTGFVVNGRIMQWNIQAPDKPVKIYDMKNSCRAFKCSLDGNIAVIGTGHIAVSSFSDKPLFAIPTDLYVKVFDIRGGRKLMSLAHHKIVYNIALSSDGHTLASYTNEDGIRVWRLEFH